MLATLTWWGIGSIIAATTLATIIATLITRKINKNSAIGTLKTVGLTGAATATLTYTGFYIYSPCFRGTYLIPFNMGLNINRHMCHCYHISVGRRQRPRANMGAYQL